SSEGSQRGGDRAEGGADYAGRGDQGLASPSTSLSTCGEGGFVGYNFESRIGGMDDQIPFYVPQIYESNHEGAFFALIHLDDALVPQLIDAYRQQLDIRVRATLVETIWQHRLLDTVGFLVETLRDNEADIWRKALDGIVAIQHPERVALL